MLRLSLSATHAALAACILAFAIGLLAIASISGSATAFAGESIEVAAKKKCKVTQRRNSKGKCVRKKCRKGTKLNKRGRCVKIRCPKGYKLNRRYKCVKIPATTNPVLDRSDLDGDGLPLWREQALGSNPNRKSIFIQFNYASEIVKASMPCDQFDAFVNAFAAAPVGNPDGSQGIDIHIDGGRTCPSRSYDMGGSRIYSPADPGCPGISDGMLNGTQIADDRINSFHVAAINPTCAWGGDGGAADSPGTKMVVFTSGSGFAMPLMHELGHNLGLDHGPANPNRRSVMNGRIYDSTNGSSSSEVLDFQRYELPALDENNLIEADGIGLPPAAQGQFVNFFCGAGNPRNQWAGESNGWIDWDCGWSGFPLDPPDIDAAPVTQDINGDGALTVLPATPTEWNTITLNGGGKIVP